LWVLALTVAMMTAYLPSMFAQTTQTTQTTQPAGQQGTGGGDISLWSTVKAGGIIGLLVILMSLVSVALVVEHFFSIRRDRILPGSLEDGLAERLALENYADAADLCRKDDSFLAKVMEAGLAQRGGMFGFFDMQSAMQEVSEREVSKLYRKLEYLSFIAASAPMLGLLGTVTGMIRSFNVIAATEGSATPSQLAGGISEALVTTCLGLIVAIPTMFFVSQFRNRIDSYVAEAETVVERLMGRFRRAGN
jgi:biopolymer transport protein ExbB